MATDVTKSIEDAEMTEREVDKVVTMMDVLQEQEDFEEDANAVLGGSDDKNCTYSKGYIKRQALYACMTCCSEAKTDPNKRAGICLACSLTCHENHELIELYTKRNLRCDCGNSKFNSHPCQLEPNKAKYNEENSYNQNFSGVYCVCQRPYPDPDCTEEDIMIQCSICEDWYHGTHLETTVPSSDLYSEMICMGCMEKNEFLHSYSYLIVNVENTDVDVMNVSENGIQTRNGDVKSDKSPIFTEDSEKSHTGEDYVDMTQKDSAISSGESNINGIDKSHKKYMENASNQNEITHESKEALTDSSIVTDDIEKTASEDQESVNAEDNDIKNNENKSDNSNEQSTTSSNQIKKVDDNEIPVTTESDTTNAAVSPTKENEENNTTEVAKDILTKPDEERIEEDRLLAEPDNEGSSSKSNSDVIKANDVNTMTVHENSNGNNDVKEVSNALNNTPNDSNNSHKSENVETQESEFCQKKTSSSESQIDKQNVKESLTKNEIKNEATSTTENHVGDMKDTSNEEGIEDTNKEQCSSDNNLCKEIEGNNHKMSEKRKLSTEDNSGNVMVKKSKLEESHDKPCIRIKNVKKIHRGSTFWPSNFRVKLCTCRECLSMYKGLSVLFLIDTNDTVIAYESLGKEKTNGKPSQYEKGLEALSSLDRIQQINALTEYNKMRDKLLDFLKSFKDRKEIVKEEDITAFFAGMKPTRKPDGVYFCR